MKVENEFSTDDRIKHYRDSKLFVQRLKVVV